MEIQECIIEIIHKKRHISVSLQVKENLEATTHQSLVEILILVWEVAELTRRTITVDEAGSKGR